MIYSIEWTASDGQETSLPFEATDDRYALYEAQNLANKFHTGEVRVRQDNRLLDTIIYEIGWYVVQRYQHSIPEIRYFKNGESFLCDPNELVDSTPITKGPVTQYANNWAIRKLYLTRLVK